MRREGKNGKKKGEIVAPSWKLSEVSRNGYFLEIEIQSACMTKEGGPVRKYFKVVTMLSPCRHHDEYLFLGEYAYFLLVKPHVFSVS